MLDMRLKESQFYECILKLLSVVYRRFFADDVRSRIGYLTGEGGDQPRLCHFPSLHPSPIKLATLYNLSYIFKNNCHLIHISLKSLLQLSLGRLVLPEPAQLLIDDTHL